MTLIADSTTDTPAEMAEALGVEVPPEETPTEEAKAVETPATETKAEETPAAATTVETTPTGTRVRDEGGKFAGAKKPDGRVQKRIDTVTKKAGDAEARAKVLEAENKKLADELAALKAGKTEKPVAAAATGTPREPVAATATEFELPKAEADAITAKFATQRTALGARPKRPKLADFQTTDDYDAALEAHDEALDTYRGKLSRIDAQEERALDARRSELHLAAQHATRTQHQLLDADKTRVAAAKAKYADFDQVVTDDVRITPVMAGRILRSKAGGELRYYLGTHRDEATRIASLPTVDEQLDAMLELELTLGRATTESHETPPPPKKISRAPEPPETELGSASSASGVDLEKMTGAEYVRYKNRQQGLEGSRRTH